MSSGELFPLGPPDDELRDAETFYRAAVSRVRAVLADPAAGSEAELLAAVLGMPHAAAVLRAIEAAAGDFRRLRQATPAELLAAGLPPVAAARLSAVLELAARYGEQPYPVGLALRGAADVYAHLRERFAAEPVELFLAVLLDNKHRLLREVTVSRGSLTASIVHPRDAFAPVVRHSAAAVIFAHNHPSGDPTPSKEDVSITRRLREVGELLGVRVLDHIVVGKGRYVSFVGDGYWE